MKGRPHRTPAQRMQRLLDAMLRWLPERQFVFVGDRGFGTHEFGTHRDEFFYTTAVSWDIRRIIALSTGRWSSATPVQEIRSCLGLETTRGWCRSAVLGVAPCLFGLDTVVAVLDHELPEGRRIGGVDWPGKVGVTFSDALSAVRRWLWSDWVVAQADGGRSVQDLPAPIREVVFSALATAA